MGSSSRAVSMVSLLIFCFSIQECLAERAEKKNGQANTLMVDPDPPALDPWNSDIPLKERVWPCKGEKGKAWFPHHYVFGCKSSYDAFRGRFKEDAATIMTKWDDFESNCCELNPLCHKDLGATDCLGEGEECFRHPYEGEGVDQDTRDANCEGDLVCARAGWRDGWDLRLFGACGSTTHCCSKVSQVPNITSAPETDAAPKTDAKAAFRPAAKEELKKAVELWQINREQALEKYGDISLWDTSQITDMSKLFIDRRLTTGYGFVNYQHKWPVKDGYDWSDSDISGWDTSQVMSMRSMFEGATAFNLNIGRWDTSKVEDMEAMFRGAASFNQDIGQWDTSNVKDMKEMFNGARSFNQDISKWDTSQVGAPGESWKSSKSWRNSGRGLDTPLIGYQHLYQWNGWGNMAWMFYRAESFNKNIGSWDTSKVVDMSCMFKNAKMFDQDIGKWDMSKVKRIGQMFEGATNFNKPIGNWDTSKVIKMSLTFAGATNFNMDIGKWNTANVQQIGNMFKNASEFNQAIGGWNTGNVERMDGMFYHALSFNQDISQWFTSKVWNMDDMFRGATNFNQDISGWNTFRLARDASMFDGAESFKYLTQWKNKNIAWFTPGLTHAWKSTILGGKISSLAEGAPTSIHESFEAVVKEDGAIDYADK